MNVMDKYFFLLLVNSTNKNKKIAVLKSINSSQYKILKDITWKILNEIIPVDNRQLKKLSKHKAFIRKLGSSKKISGQVLGKNYSIVIEIIQIDIQHNEISSKVCPSTKRRMGKSKSSLEKSKTIGYCKRKEESTSTESGEEQFSESSEEHVSSEELSSEEEEFSSEGNYTEKSECSSSGEEFTEEYSETEESFKEKTEQNKSKEEEESI